MKTNAVHPFARTAKAGAALVLALGLGAALLPMASSAMPGGGRGDMQAMHGHGGGMGGAMMGERLLDSVNASADQRSRIRDIFKAAAADHEKLRQDGRALRDQTMQALAQPTVDAARLEVLRQQQLAQHDQASRRHLQAMVEAANVLTPEQRKLMAEQVAKRRELMERHQRERGALEGAPKR
jgi:periplasmic protein CpxP/Spy